MERKDRETKTKEKEINMSFCSVCVHVYTVIIDKQAHITSLSNSSRSIVKDVYLHISDFLRGFKYYLSIKENKSDCWHHNNCLSGFQCHMLITPVQGDMTMGHPSL